MHVGSLVQIRNTQDLGLDGSLGIVLSFEAESYLVEIISGECLGEQFYFFALELLEVDFSVLDNIPEYKPKETIKLSYWK